MTLQKQKTERIKTKQLKENPSLIGQEVSVKGWIRTVRNQKTFSFIELNDGSQLSNIQIIADGSLPEYENLLEGLQTGAAISVTGEVCESPGGKQALEVKASHIAIIGPAPGDYVLQKKRHSFEFLRTIAHLRPRTNTFGAVTRVRNTLAFATHEFFQQRGFYYIHTPIITSSDCEGAGEMFTVTSLPMEKVPKNKGGRVDYTSDFFGRQAHLTVSGQLNVEAFSLSLSDVYTFGPTFRAENSNTSRHLAEFWMIEPEIAFADLTDDMDLAEAYLKFVVKSAFEKNEEDIAFFTNFIDKELTDRLRLFLDKPCIRLPYTEAVEILAKSGISFEFPVKWGVDLQSEHERFLTEKHFQAPVILYNYPKSIKPFYMRNNDDEKTVAAMDLLVPGVGELIGGSQREERMDVLQANIKAHGLDPEIYSWYIDLRKYGSAPHAGFGLGFERLVQYVTGMENIRDVIPYPRYPKHAEY